MIHGLSDLFKANDRYEINRVVGAFGGFLYVICANVFVGYEVFIRGRAFNVAEYCLAFPSGLGAVVLAIGGAVAIKDRNVAKAKVTAEKGSV